MDIQLNIIIFLIVFISLLVGFWVGNRDNLKDYSKYQNKVRIDRLKGKINAKSNRKNS